MVLPCSLSMCFFCPFSILITLLGEEGAGLCAYRDLVVSYAHVNLCHFFFSSWCQGLAATSACGSYWTSLSTFLPFDLSPRDTIYIFKYIGIVSFYFRVIALYLNRK